jgi:ribosomal protein S18 acetylase RimI-like enzyme
LVIERSQKIMGWMTLHRNLKIEDHGFLQVASLVVDEDARGKGLGKDLMIYAELRAAQMQLRIVGLYSRIQRLDAHKFYERIGYSKAKESYFFKKDLL